MPTTRSGGGSSRKGPSAHSEVIAMLKDDHNRAKKAFTDFEKLDVLEDAAECEALVKQTCAELEAHATLEEELFYPAAREALDEDDLVDEAEVEHMTVRMLIEQLKDMSPEEEKYAATFKVLGEYVKHHLKEEEEEMFGQLSRAKIDWEDLEQKMLERREELMSQLLPAAGKKAEKPAEAKAKPHAKGKEKSKRGRQTSSDVSDIDQAEEVEEIGAGRYDDTLYAGADDE